VYETKRVTYTISKIAACHRITTYVPTYRSHCNVTRVSH